MSETIEIETVSYRDSSNPSKGDVTSRHSIVTEPGLHSVNLHFKGSLVSTPKNLVSKSLDDLLDASDSESEETPITTSSRRTANQYTISQHLTSSDPTCNVKYIIIIHVSQPLTYICTLTLYVYIYGARPIYLIYRYPGLHSFYIWALYIMAPYFT